MQTPHREDPNLALELNLRPSYREARVLIVTALPQLHTDQVPHFLFLYFCLPYGAACVSLGPFIYAIYGSIQLCSKWPTAEKLLLPGDLQSRR